jgi:hypothetical protein
VSNNDGTFWVGANSDQSIWPGTLLMTSTNGLTWSPVPSNKRPSSMSEGRGLAYGLDGSGNALWVLVGNGSLNKFESSSVKGK